MIIGSNIISVDELTSSNTYMSSLLKQQDLRDGTVVTTLFQTGGRGQSGNKWESETGKNLLFSILLRPPEIPAEKQFLLSMMISLGICDFADRFVKPAKIKWPNDIYVKNDKIAGILIENTIMENMTDYSVAGIGFNINQMTFLSDAPNPVSLKMITGIDYDLEKCLNDVLEDLDRRYKQLLSGDTRQLRNDYTARLYRFREWSKYSDITGTFTGRITSVSPEGLLHVEKEPGVSVNYSFKEIDFII
ncbi:MAG TPA: biotin--[acetyl-CoA-carboxylase] ligase [Bacteroidales bacterium]|nr:biotin--[acetyl-CoA-carboxylase] ligase [Bacteroidales bacterium]